MAPAETAPPQEQEAKSAAVESAGTGSPAVIINIEGEPSAEIEDLLANAVESGLFANLHHLSPGGFTILVGDQGDISFIGGNRDMGKLFGKTPGLLVPPGTNIEKTVFGVVVTVEINEFRLIESQQGTQRALITNATFKVGGDDDTMKGAATYAVEKTLEFIEKNVDGGEGEPQS